MVLVSEAFREARRNKPIGDLVACLDSLNDLPCFQSYKRMTWERLAIKAGARVLDVGCGVGYDVIGMAKCQPAAVVTGVDLSKALLDIARQRAAPLANTAFVAANGTMLPFKTGTFDAVRIDRSLQHAERPGEITGEMARVGRDRAIVLAAEPDWGTFILHNGDIDTSDLLVRAWQKTFRNAYIGRELQGLFAAAGLQQISVRSHPLLLTDLRAASAVYDLERLLSYCVSEAIVSAAAAQSWQRRAQASSEAGTFFSYLSIIEVTGIVARPTI